MEQRDMSGTSGLKRSRGTRPKSRASKRSHASSDSSGVLQVTVARAAPMGSRGSSTKAPRKGAQKRSHPPSAASQAAGDAGTAAPSKGPADITVPSGGSDSDTLRHASSKKGTVSQGPSATALSSSGALGAMGSGSETDPAQMRQTPTARSTVPRFVIYMAEIYPGRPKAVGRTAPTTVSRADPSNSNSNSNSNSYSNSYSNSNSNSNSNSYSNRGDVGTAKSNPQVPRQDTCSTQGSQGTVQVSPVQLLPGGHIGKDARTPTSASGPSSGTHSSTGADGAPSSTAGLAPHDSSAPPVTQSSCSTLPMLRAQTASQPPSTTAQVAGKAVTATSARATGITLPSGGTHTGTLSHDLSKQGSANQGPSATAHSSSGALGTMDSKAPSSETDTTQTQHTGTARSTVPRFVIYMAEVYPGRAKAVGRTAPTAVSRADPSNSNSNSNRGDGGTAMSTPRVPKQDPSSTQGSQGTVQSSPVQVFPGGHSGNVSRTPSSASGPPSGAPSSTRADGGPSSMAATGNWGTCATMPTVGAKTISQPTSAVVQAAAPSGIPTTSAGTRDSSLHDAGDRRVGATNMQLTLSLGDSTSMGSVGQGNSTTALSSSGSLGGKEHRACRSHRKRKSTTAPSEVGMPGAGTTDPSDLESPNSKLQALSLTHASILGTVAQGSMTTALSSSGNQGGKDHRVRRTVKTRKSTTAPSGVTPSGGLGAGPSISINLSGGTAHTSIPGVGNRATRDIKPAIRKLQGLSLNHASIAGTVAHGNSAPALSSSGALGGKEHRALRYDRKRKVTTTATSEVSMPGAGTRVTSDLESPNSKLQALSLTHASIPGTVAQGSMTTALSPSGNQCGKDQRVRTSVRNRKPTTEPSGFTPPGALAAGPAICVNLSAGAAHSSLPTAGDRVTRGLNLPIRNLQALSLSHGSIPGTVAQGNSATVLASSGTLHGNEHRARRDARKWNSSTAPSGITPSGGLATGPSISVDLSGGAAQSGLPGTGNRITRDIQPPIGKLQGLSLTPASLLGNVALGNSATALASSGALHGKEHRACREDRKRKSATAPSRVTPPGALGAGPLNTLNLSGGPAPSSLPDSGTRVTSDLNSLISRLQVLSLSDSNTGLTVAQGPLPTALSTSWALGGMDHRSARAARRKTNTAPSGVTTSGALGAGPKVPILRGGAAHSSLSPAGTRVSSDLASIISKMQALSLTHPSIPGTVAQGHSATALSNPGVSMRKGLRASSSDCRPRQTTTTPTGLPAFPGPSSAGLPARAAAPPKTIPTVKSRAGSRDDFEIHTLITGLAALHI